MRRKWRASCGQAAWFAKTTVFCSLNFSENSRRLPGSVRGLNATNSRISGTRKGKPAGNLGSTLPGPSSPPSASLLTFLTLFGLRENLQNLSWQFFLAPFCRIGPSRALRARNPGSPKRVPQQSRKSGPPRVQEECAPESQKSPKVRF